MPKPTNVSFPRGKSAQAKADDQVMATNSSSIVSKRSVERLYHPNEPHFFRYFVPKPQRRAPLINRGYWLRLRVIDVLVRDFLHDAKKRGRRAVVVNLGCGSDVLPWQCLTRYPEESKRVLFVDVDFPDLIEHKRQTVLNTPELVGAFTGLKGPGETVKPVVLQTDQYVQIGCDLRDLVTFRKGLDAVLRAELAECEFIFVAEVSITYMETEGADRVIQWASTLGNAEFILLEQILPDGEDHPFASTMLNHFQKLNTPLKSVKTYATITDQHTRFLNHGWPSVRVWTLWQAWADETFLPADERRRLDEIEPFDEWEEFALFGSHYCVVHARTEIEGTTTYNPPPAVPKTDGIPIKEVPLQFDPCPGQKGQRRFAAAMQLSSDRPKEQPVLLNVLGLGIKTRLQSCDLFSYGVEPGSEATFAFRGGIGPAARMCHSLTDLGSVGVLLAGGRGSPSTPVKDCWLFDRSLRAWRRTDDLPVPLYRHSVVALGESGMALLVGGRGEKDLFEGALLYHPEAGWVDCQVAGERPEATYGAVLACVGASRAGYFAGIYTGGIKDGLIADQLLRWELDISDVKKPSIRFTSMQVKGVDNEQIARWLFGRFGATCLQHSEGFFLLGGVTRDHLLSRADEVLSFAVSTDELIITKRVLGQCAQSGVPVPRPLLAGHSAISLPDGSITIVGGGATCFSMGTFWNGGIYTLRFAESDRNETAASQLASRWTFERAVDIVPGEQVTPTRTIPQVNGEKARITPIPNIKLQSPDEFLKILREGRPVVFKGLDLGSCVSSWTLDYLESKIGTDRKVVIHEAATQAMDFNSKNFRYVTTDFGDFARRAQRGDKLYLRALSQDKPSEKPTVLADDYPEIAADFVLPPQLSSVKERLFSSVLRLSGPVNMWLHYDVMANVYCQIGGSKRMVLFPPADVEYFSFAPGASSSSVDVFSTLGTPELAATHPHVAELGPGDVLFLPALWLHTAMPTSSVSIAVNVFFRDLDNTSYAPGRDVYGNRDLGAYEKGRQDIARIANSFSKLPAEVREFYLLRLADELRSKARS